MEENQGVTSIEPKGEEWLLKDILPAVGLGFLVGPSKSRKSFYAVSLAAHVATGCTFCERIPRTCGVVYIAAEAPEGVRKRFKAWREENSIEGAPMDLIAAAPNLTSEDDVQDLTETLREASAQMQSNGVKLGLVIIDTLAASTHGADENSSTDMGGVMSRLQSVAAELNIMVLVVAHTGKDQSKGIRGWSGQYAGADVVLNVERIKEDKDFSVVTVDKLKDAEDGKKFQFKLKQVILGIDKDGDNITSAVPLFEEASGNTALRRHPITKSGEIILTAIANLRQQQLQQSEKSETLNVNDIEIPLYDLREECFRLGLGGPAPAEEIGTPSHNRWKEARNKNFKRSLTKLVDQNLLNEQHGRYKIKTH